MPKVKLTKPRTLRQPKCPECNKLKAVQPQSQAIGEFVDWLAHEKGIVLAHSHTHTDACYTHGFSKARFRREFKGNAAYSPEELQDGRCESPQCGLQDDELHYAHVGIEKLLADFFGINLKKRAAEQDRLLAWIRSRDATVK